VARRRRTRSRAGCVTVRFHTALFPFFIAAVLSQYGDGEKRTVMFSEKLHAVSKTLEGVQYESIGRNAKRFRIFENAFFVAKRQPKIARHFNAG
jgi:hypothetical protein